MRVEWEVLEYRTRHVFHIARARGSAVRRSVWIRLVDDDGVEGWGEACGNIFYGETADTVTAVLPRYAQVLQDALARGDGFQLERIERELEVAIGHNPAARAGISAALHDLIGKRLGQPVWKLWGLDPAAAPKSSFTLGIDSVAVMREKLGEAKTYPIIKVKVGTDRDYEVLSLIRSERPDAVIYVDANTAWNAKQAVQQLPMLEDFEVAMIEQPFRQDDLEAFRLLRLRSRIPILADESCHVATDVAKLAGCVDGVNIKLEKCGSLREALRIVHAARAHGMLVMIGCMISTTLGIAAALQLTPLMDYVDLDAAALLADDPFAGPGLNADGTLRLNQEPGLGVRKQGQGEVGSGSGVRHSRG